MFKIPVWRRRVITAITFLVLLWFGATGDTQTLRVMALALAFWVPFSLHFFWRLTDENERDGKPDGG
jgi:Mn2+/Fe2+ NRAMP family transporter